MPHEAARPASPPWPGGWRGWFSPERPVRLGVSACLVGDAVRYDGGHKRDLFLTETLSPWVRWTRVCPEMEVGMGVPRPPIRLEEARGGVRLVEPETGQDHTDKMRRWAKVRIGELTETGLDGYVLKSASPSCGLGSVKVHRAGRGSRARGGEVEPREPGAGAERMLHARGSGVFAAELRKRWPGLPVVEERALAGRSARKDFVERAFVRNRWRALAERGSESGASGPAERGPEPGASTPAERGPEPGASTPAERGPEPGASGSGRPDRAALVAYHEAHKFLFLARDESTMRRLGRLAGEARGSRSLFARYGAGLAAVLAVPARRGGHVNALQHARGFLKQALEPEEARRLDVAIEEYRLANAPRSRPLDLVRRLALRHDCRYLLGQLYFDPFPEELLGGAQPNRYDTNTKSLHFRRT